MTLLAGRYELLHPVWRDPLGTTFIARDRTGWPIAVRLLPAALSADPAVRTRFREDGPLLLSLRHENLAPVRDLVATETQLAIAADAVDGATLRQRLRAGRLPRLEVHDIEAAVAAGLAALHEAGLTHGLIGPATVALPRGGARLTDVAVTRLVADSATGRTLLRAAAAYPSRTRRPDEYACRALHRDLSGLRGAVRPHSPVRLRVVARAM